LKALALIVDGALTRQAETAALAPHTESLAALERGGTVGATLRFEGIVRETEADLNNTNAPRALAALHYQTYDPMAQRALQELANSVAQQHALTSLIALHSRGRVEVGQISFVLVAHAAHRAETLAAITQFIDRMKKDLPIWKLPDWKVVG